MIHKKPDSALAYYYQSVSLFKQRELKESDAYLKLTENKSPKLFFAKDKALYFQFRKDLAELMGSDCQFNSYKNKNYLVSENTNPKQNFTQLWSMLTGSTFTTIIAVLLLLLLKSKRLSMPEMPPKND